MRHDWVFDVLKDLRRYAEKNGLPALAARVDAALAVAEVEIAAQDDSPALHAETARRPGRPH
jgi:predicted transcriptional regulator